MRAMLPNHQQGGLEADREKMEGEDLKVERRLGLED